MLAAVLEYDPRAGDQILHGGGDQDLSRPGQRHDPGTDVDREAADMLPGELDLSGVQPAAQLQAQARDLLGDLA